MASQEQLAAQLPPEASTKHAGDASSPAPLAKAGPRSPHSPPSAPMPEVLTADELAAMLRINRKTVYAAFKAGELPGGKRIGGTIRFSRDAVLRWLAEGQVSRSSRGLR